jgi:hypothetical protein
MSEPALLASKTITIRTVGPPHDTMPPICYEVPYMPANNACFRDDRFRYILGIGVSIIILKRPLRFLSAAVI